MASGKVIARYIVAAVVVVTAVTSLVLMFRTSALAPRLGIDATHVYCERRAKRYSVPIGEVLTDGRCSSSAARICGCSTHAMITSIARPSPA